MCRRPSAAFLLLVAVSWCSAAETAENAEQTYSTLPAEKVEQKYSTLPVQVTQAEDSGKLDYESALRPAVLQKRSIANIARLLLGGNVPPNHPLVKYPDVKAWNLASNIVASLPGGLQAAGSTQSEAWAQRQPSSTLQNLQQLFETKAKILPYTGQVATGLTGLASVKGDIIRQIHSISTQAIAQAAAEAAARALASAAAAHAVTNSIAHSVNPGAQTGIKSGWSAYPEKTPSDQAGPPYQESAHINHYQAPPSSYHQYNPYAQTTPAPPTQPAYSNPTQPAYNPAYNTPSQPAYNAPAQVAYNTQPAYNPTQAAYTPTQPQPHLQPYQNGYYTLYNTQQQASSQTPYTPAPPVAARPTLSPQTLIATTPSVPAGVFGRHAASPAAPSSLFSTISSLLSASTAAYNAAFNGHGGEQPQPSTLFPALLSAPGSSPLPAPPHRAPSRAAPAPGGSLHAASSYAGSAYQSQSAHALPQGGGHYGGPPSGPSPSYLQQSGPGYAAAGSEARPASVHAPGYPVHAPSAANAGAHYAQPGGVPYAAPGVQPSSQFGAGYPSGGAAIGGAAAASAPGASYSTGGGAGGAGVGGPGYPSYGAAAGPRPGHAGGWNPGHAGPSASASSWPSSAAVGYPGAAPGNAGYSPGGGAAPAPSYPLAAGSHFAQQAYPAPAPNAYQPPAPVGYAPAQQPQYPGYGPGRLHNPNLAEQRLDNQDLRGAATTMGNDYDQEPEEPERHHSYQPGSSSSNASAKKQQRPHSYSRYPSPQKKRPASKPRNKVKDAYSVQQRPQHHHHHHHHQAQQPAPQTVLPKAHHHHHNKLKQSEGKRVVEVGGGGGASKKGSHFSSSKVRVELDASVDEYAEGSPAVVAHDLSRNSNPSSGGRRWRPQDPSGGRPRPLHHHHPDGGRRGTTPEPQQVAPTHEPRHGQRPKGTRPPSRPKGPGHADPASQRGSRPPTEAAHLYRDQLKEKQHKHFNSEEKWKSRDVYTTLPEFVFRVGERPDVFLRPGGKRREGAKPRGGGASLRGRQPSVYPRVGETDGRGSRVGDDDEERSATAEEGGVLPQHHNVIYDEAVVRREPPSEEYADGEEAELTRGGGEEEELVGAGEASHETPAGHRHAMTRARGEQQASTAVLNSEELDPEEREAFVESVYSDAAETQHYPSRRQDYRGEEEEEEFAEDGAVEEPEQHVAESREVSSAERYSPSAEDTSSAAAAEPPFYDDEDFEKRKKRKSEAPPAAA